MGFHCFNNIRFQLLKGSQAAQTKKRPVEDAFLFVQKNFIRS